MNPVEVAARLVALGEGPWHWPAWALALRADFIADPTPARLAAYCDAVDRLLWSKSQNKEHPTP